MKASERAGVCAVPLEANFLGYWNCLSSAGRRPCREEVHRGGANNPDETYPPCQVIIQSMGGRQGEPRVVRAVQPCVFESIPESVSHARPPPARPPGSQFPPPIALASIQFVGYYLDSKKKKKQHKNWSLTRDEFLLKNPQFNILFFFYAIYWFLSYTRRCLNLYTKVWFW